MKERDLRVERWKMTKEAMEEEALLSLTPGTQHDYMARIEKRRERVAAFDSSETVIFRLTGELAKLSVTLNKQATSLAHFAFGASALQLDKHPSVYKIKVLAKHKHSRECAEINLQWLSCLGFVGHARQHDSDRSWRRRIAHQDCGDSRRETR